MQNISDYILEKLKLSDNTKVKKIKPNDYNDLRSIIKERLQHREYINKKIIPVDLNDIDVSGIKNFDDLFRGLDLTAVDMSDWNVSNVVVFDHTFFETTGASDLDISNWNTSKGELFNCMFANSDFNGDISNWDLSNAKYTTQMFGKNAYFDCDLSNWDVSNVTEMAGMFYNATVFTGKGLGNWNTGSVTNMSLMFKNCSNLDVDLSTWATGNVNNHENMFEGTNIPKEKQPIFKN